MCLLGIKRNEILTLLIIMILHSAGAESIPSLNTTWNSTTCPIPLKDLDFIYNATQSDPEIIWPCEVRIYWLNLRPFVKVVRFLLTYVTGFIIILGVTLNTISFGMLSTSMLNDSNLSLYLRALAISDNGALVFNYAVGIAKSRFPYINDLFMKSKFLCQLNSVTMELFQFTSTWLVVSLTWTRVCVVIFPFQTRSTCQSRSAIIIMATLICVSFTISLTKLYSGGYEIDSVFEFVPCQKKLNPWGSTMHLYVALSTWLPLLFISIGNVLLIIQMRKFDKIRVQLTGSEANLTHRSSTTLLAVSIVYLVLLLPIGIVETLELYWDVVLIKYPSIGKEANEQYVNWLEEKMLLKWCRGLVFHIYHWNFAINFFLYYLTGKKFRDSVTCTFKNYRKFLCLKRFPNWISMWSKQKNFSLFTIPSTISLIKVIKISDRSIYYNDAEQNTDDTGTVT
ncbi:uncharacterized protein LOC107273099 [Cephus cinctus]|uniref:Uncharacterized protein LOC107273099 n=1 Tax=Cephus cinctus TaxID=211228 RepID=A0AAJ7FSS9_CEPCN|nr:uncharacterized protein LOC107273099 [Cephus cinctus]